MAESLRKEALIAKLADARDRMGGHSLGIRRTLSPAEVIKRSHRRHPAVLFGGAVLLGLLLSRIPARRKTVKVEVPRWREKKSDKTVASGAGRAAVVATVLKFGLDLAKPALTRWLRTQAASYASNKWGQHGAPFMRVPARREPGPGSRHTEKSPQEL